MPETENSLDILAEYELFLANSEEQLKKTKQINTIEKIFLIFTVLISSNIQMICSILTKTILFNFLLHFNREQQN